MATVVTALVKASTFYTIDLDAEIVADETVVIGGKTYTFKATPAADGDVQYDVGDDHQVNAENLRKAVNLEGTAGTEYHAEMTRNPYCDASWDGTDVLTIYARVAGAVGNLIPVTVGTSGITLDNALLENGAGSFDTFIDELQAGFQINSALIQALAGAED